MWEIRKKGILTKTTKMETDLLVPGTVENLVWLEQAERQGEEKERWLETCWVQKILSALEHFEHLNTADFKYISLVAM